MQEKQYKNKEKLHNWIGIISFVLIIAFISLFLSISTIQEENENELLESLGFIKGELYLSEKGDWKDIIDIVDNIESEEHLSRLDDWKQELNDEELKKLITNYSIKVEEYYIKDNNLELLEKIVRLKDFPNDLPPDYEFELNKFHDLNRELLITDVRNIIDNEVTNQIIIEKDKQAEQYKKEMEQQEKEDEKKYAEYNIYKYMKSQFDILTNYGANYLPDIHDTQVEQLASVKFGISPQEAGRIYIKFETQ
ncbi:MAG: hypothetical protein ABS939_22195 [Psychrobacillus sp.]